MRAEKKERSLNVGSRYVITPFCLSIKLTSWHHRETLKKAFIIKYVKQSITIHDP